VTERVGRRGLHLQSRVAVRKGGVTRARLGQAHKMLMLDQASLYVGVRYHSKELALLRSD